MQELKLKCDCKVLSICPSLVRYCPSLVRKVLSVPCSRPQGATLLGHGGGWYESGESALGMCHLVILHICTAEGQSHEPDVSATSLFFCVDTSSALPHTHQRGANEPQECLVALH